ncbi:MAG: PQQ-like beta-propeller repeat protein [Verrucomicrobia bacterium]|nr:PQQ-like beta-propeller repeat protein [Verrucomicrobiota bacterium]
MKSVSFFWGICRIWPLVVVTLNLGLNAADWNQFRGPEADGVVRHGNPPMLWSESRNVDWKVAIHDRGWSSPVVSGDQIWLTTATEDGTKLYAICVDAVSGRVQYDQLLFQIEDPQFAHKFNSYASPTPIVHEGRVYVTFGSPGTACIDTRTFETLWTREDLVCDHFRGAGSSPVLHNGKLIMHFDGADYQYAIALDSATGKTLWKSDRSVDFRDLTPDGKPQADGDFRKAFSTPYLLQESQHGPWVMASLGSKAAYGYDPDSGQELWRIEDHSGHSGTCVPFVFQGKIGFVTGFSRGTLYTIPVGSRGALNSDSIQWSVKRNVPNKPSPVLANNLLFMVDDGGIASCIDPVNGSELWRERIGGNFSASPLVANNHVYFFSEEGVTTLVEASATFKINASNLLANGFMATPAVYKNSFLLRTKSHLYKTLW